MDTSSHSDDAEASLDTFRERVGSFIRNNAPAAARKVAGNVKLVRSDMADWQRTLFERGWGAPGWPVEHGGTGWTPMQRMVFEQVAAEHDCPPQPLQGLRHIGPLIIAHGSEEQKRRYLPRILRCDDWWCQGFSEPGAGSDLASLATKATRERDHYVVQGQKLWTSHGHESDMMFALVRTSRGERKQEGISMLLIPMHSPGIRVRPIPTIDGWHHVNEVFFDDVRVPVENLVGAEGQGWSLAKFLLDRERLGPAELIPGALRFVGRVRSLLEGRESIGTFDRMKAELSLTEVEAELTSLMGMALRAVRSVMNGDALNIEPSLLKLGWSQAVQKASEVAFDIVTRLPAASLVREGTEPRTDEERRGAWIQTFLYYRAFTIYGGSSEIQKNLIARHILG